MGITSTYTFKISNLEILAEICDLEKLGKKSTDSSHLNIIVQDLFELGASMALVFGL